MDPIEVLLEHFDEETVALILTFLEDDDIIELVEALLEEDLEEQDPNGEYVVEMIKSLRESMEKAEKTIRIAISAMILRKWPPFLKKKERDARKLAKETVKLKSNYFRDLKKRVRTQNLLVKFRQEQIKIIKKQIVLKDLLKDLDRELKDAWNRFWQNIIAKVGMPGVYFILIVGILSFLVLGVSAAFSSEEEVKKNGMQSAYGINNKGFYGARLIYEDKEQENLEIVKNFAGILADSVTAVETENKSVDVTINVDENTDYLSVESNAETEPVINILTSIATEVYKIDNPTETVPATLTDIVGGIKYFGINNVENMQEKVATAIYNYINENDLYQKAGDTELPDDVENKIQLSVTTEVAKNVVRTEKLFVEDQIFKTDSDVLTVKTSRNYKAMIFMPKNDITFSCISLKSYGINSEDFKVYIRSGDTKIEMNTTYTKEINQYSHETKETINIPSSKFVAIDEQKPLNGALSLVPSVENYLEIAKDEEGNEITGVYTYSKTNVYVEFESSVPFIFAEMRTEWK